MCVDKERKRNANQISTSVKASIFSNTCRCAERRLVVAESSDKNLLQELGNDQLADLHKKISI